MSPQHVERPLDAGRPERDHLHAGEHRAPRAILATEHPRESSEVLNCREQSQCLETGRQWAIDRQKPDVAEDRDTTPTKRKLSIDYIGVCEATIQTFWKNSQRKNTERKLLMLAILRLSYGRTCHANALTRQHSRGPYGRRRL